MAISLNRNGSNIVSFSSGVGLTENYVSQVPPLSCPVIHTYDILLNGRPMALVGLGRASAQTLKSKQIKKFLSIQCLDDLIYEPHLAVKPHYYLAPANGRGVKYKKCTRTQIFTANNELACDQIDRVWVHDGKVSPCVEQRFGPRAFVCNESTFVTSVVETEDNEILMTEHCLLSCADYDQLAQNLIFLRANEDATPRLQTNPIVARALERFQNDDLTFMHAIVAPRYQESRRFLHALDLKITTLVDDTEKQLATRIKASLEHAFLECSYASTNTLNHSQMLQSVLLESHNWPIVSKRASNEFKQFVEPLISSALRETSFDEINAFVAMPCRTNNPNEQNAVAIIKSSWKDHHEFYNRELSRIHLSAVKRTVLNSYQTEINGLTNPSNVFKQIINWIVSLGGLLHYQFFKEDNLFAAFLEQDWVADESHVPVM